MKNVFIKLINFFSSYALAATLLIALMIITVLGTLEQVQYGLYEVQKKYFESFFFFYEITPQIKIILPGIYLLLILFSVNLLLGGIFRLPLNKKNAGVFITHLGILFILVSGFITFQFGQYGNMALLEGESSNTFSSYNEWELSVLDVQTNLEYIIYEEDMKDIPQKGLYQFFHLDLPFEIHVLNYYRNAELSTQAKISILEELPLEMENEKNIAGCSIVIMDKFGKKILEDVLLGYSKDSISWNEGDKSYRMELHKKTWYLPFIIQLKKFTHEKHPNTQIAKTFSSDVIKIENGIERNIRISMNQPLRHLGYTFYQASYNDQLPQGVLQSILAVSKNPADQYPKYGCFIVCLGLLVRFSQLLVVYLKRRGK